MQPKDDEIVEEVRRIRDEHAAAHEYDLVRIVADLREQERASDAAVVTLKPRSLCHCPGRQASNKALQATRPQVCSPGWRYFPAARHIQHPVIGRAA